MTTSTTKHPTTAPSSLTASASSKASASASSSSSLSSATFRLLQQQLYQQSTTTGSRAFSFLWQQQQPASQHHLIQQHQQQPQDPPSSSKSRSAAPAMPSKRERENEEAARAKKAKRKGGKACVYCRRSHMVCEGGRPCERCIKRDIAHLCRDVTPPASTGTTPVKKEPQTQQPQSQSMLPPAEPIQPPQAQPQPQPQQAQQQQLFDSGSSWPLLPDANGHVPQDTLDFSALTRTPSGMGSWDGAGEFGILSEMLKTLRVPNMPGDFYDALNQIVRDQNATMPQQQQHPPQQLQQVQDNTAGPSHQPQQPDSNGNSSTPNKNSNGNSAKGKGKGKGKAEPLSSISRIEQYLLAAADQPDGSRASRLTQVIRAKYEAGLLKPYDYIKGYERMNRWMDSGRAARVEGSRASSPTKGGTERRNMIVPAPPSGSSISPESRRRILAALEVFRPRFRRIAKELTDLDLVFVEEANERLMLQYDRALASIHTPSCIWRRTGEIQKANQEFAQLTGIPAPLFRNGQLCVYELMDEDSAVRFWEGYGKVAFEKGQSHMYTHCTLKIPLSLTRAQPAQTQGNTPAVAPTMSMSTVPDLTLPGAMSSSGPGGTPGGQIEEEYRVIKTCFSMTIRRDRYDIPVAIMGQWIPITPTPSNVL